MQCGTKSKFNLKKATPVERAVDPLIKAPSCQELYDAWVQALMAWTKTTTEIQSLVIEYEMKAHLCADHKDRKACVARTDVNKRLGDLSGLLEQLQKELALRTQGILNRCFRKKPADVAGQWIAHDQLAETPDGGNVPKG